MTFNPLAAALVASATDLVPQPRTVIEFGNQSFTADTQTIEFIIRRFGRSTADIDIKALRRLQAMDPAERRPETANFYRALGFTDYCAIDVNDRYGSLMLDLNRPLRQHYGFNRTFGLVTNNGTGEHIFDQAAVFRNIHDLVAVGGVMLCAVPFLNYVNHGFYSFHPCLFADLARANAYELVALGYADRWGRGSTVVDGKGSLLLPLLPKEMRSSLPVMLARTSRVEKGLRSRLRRWKHEVAFRIGRIAARPSSAQFSRQLRGFMLRREDVMTFAIMRKTIDAEFRVPIQGKYRDAIQDHSIREDYDAPPAPVDAAPASAKIQAVQDE